MPSERDGKSKGGGQVTQSVVERVTGSWELVKPYADDVGMDFFLRLFKKFPHLLVLFPFGNVQDASDLSSSKALQTHAHMVMSTVGDAVAGLTDIEMLIPKLRALGKMHTLVGVQPEHYDALYGILMGAIQDKVDEKLGGHIWTDEIDEAWQLVYGAITSVMKEPTRALETEQVEGWGLLIAISSVWFSIGTPFQMAGFAGTNIWLRLVLGFMNFFAFCTIFVDMIALWVLDAVALKDHTKVKIRSVWHLRYRKITFKARFYTNRIVRRIQLERWLPWPKEDAMILLTFPLQFVSCFFNSGYDRQAFGVQGVHWITIFTLLRLLSIRRVLHFMRCAETSSFLQYRMRSKGRENIRVWKLIGVLFYVMHVAACVWSIIVKVEVGLGVEEAVSESTSFESSNKLFGYLSAIHWAWVSLAGIGNTEIVPTTSLQIVVNLAVHLIGATLYAVVTGQVLSMLQDYAEKDNMMANEIGALSEFMDSANMPPASRERIITSYFMQNHLARKGQSVVAESQDEESAPELPEKILEKLPAHHKHELKVYTRTEAARWRSRQQLSPEFCYALAESLSKTASLLAGDYLFQKGDKVKRGVMLIESGTLEVIVDGMSVQTLNSGDIIGKGWMSMKKDDTREMQAARLYADYLAMDGRARASIRAMTSCRFVTGINLRGQAMDMQKRFPEDIKSFRTGANTRGMKWLKSIVTAQKVIGALGGHKKKKSKRDLFQEQGSRHKKKKEYSDDADYDSFFESSEHMDEDDSDHGDYSMFRESSEFLPEDSTGSDYDDFQESTSYHYNLDEDVEDIFGPQSDEEKHVHERQPQDGESVRVKKHKHKLKSRRRKMVRNNSSLSDLPEEDVKVVTSPSRLKNQKDAIKPRETEDKIPSIPISKQKGRVSFSDNSQDADAVGSSDAKSSEKMAQDLVDFITSHLQQEGVDIKLAQKSV